MQITDKAIIVEIYNSPIISTRKIAAKYSDILDKKIITRTISEIKGATGPYKPIIDEYKQIMARFLFRRKYGYDPIKKYTPPPWGKSDQAQVKSIPSQFKSGSNQILKKSA